MSKPNNPPAFPVDRMAVLKQYPHPNDGMTLRDYFAAKAMQSIISHHGKINAGEIGAAPKTAYLWADAMLAEREKGEGSL